LPLGDFKGKAGAAESADRQIESGMSGIALSQMGLDDLSHAKVSAVLNALGGAEHNLAYMKMGTKPDERRAEELRGDNRDDNLGLGDSLFTAGDSDLRRELGDHRDDEARGQWRFPRRRSLKR
jgi:hypothetical protein